MLLLYNLGIRFYFLFIKVASAFNEKAKLWINGRKNTSYQQFTQSAWFHFASLGEYEQGLPVLTAYKASRPDLKIVITFFSPSGFEIRKNTPLADAVYYLPLDTRKNAKALIAAINPVVAVFTKYEYWYHFFKQLKKNKVPLYVISGIFRPGQVFFQWYGGLHRSMLRMVTHFFVQDEDSKLLLDNIGIDPISVSGDTRFDRVWVNAQQRKSFPQIGDFVQGHTAIIAGSTWPEDEVLLAALVRDQPDWKFIIAPHEISEEKINKLIELLPSGSAVRYSQLTADRSHQTLIIDNIGMLSSLYPYGHMAFIGGGFGAGIHNTLEAAAFGIPVIFGPNYERFKEARDMITARTGFCVTDENELKKIAAYLSGDEHRYQAISLKIKAYVREHIGATEMIMGYLLKP